MLPMEVELALERSGVSVGEVKCIHTIVTEINKEPASNLDIKPGGFYQ